MVAKERLAGSLIELSFPAGAEIVREGETGDRFYMLIDGQIGATERGRPAGRGSLSISARSPCCGTFRGRRRSGADGRSALCARARRLPRGGHGLRRRHGSGGGGRCRAPCAPPLPAELADRHELVAPRRAAREKVVQRPRWSACSRLAISSEAADSRRAGRRSRPRSSRRTRARRWRGAHSGLPVLRIDVGGHRIQLQLLDDRQDALVRVEARRAKEMGRSQPPRRRAPLLDLAAHLVVADFGQTRVRHRVASDPWPASRIRWTSSGRSRTRWPIRKNVACASYSRSSSTTAAVHTDGPSSNVSAIFTQRARTSLPQPCPRSARCALGPRDGFPSRARSRGRRTSAGAHRRARPGGRWSPGRPARAPTAGELLVLLLLEVGVHRPAVRQRSGLPSRSEIRSTISSENVSPSSSAWTCASAAV